MSDAIAIGDDAAAGRLRPYVVQHHTGRGDDHFDLMIQGDQAALWTWQLAGWPVRQAGQGVQARRIANHRPAYLTYEGPISGGRGECRIVCRGDCTVTGEPDGQAMEIDLGDGPQAGQYRLERSGAAEDLWRLTRLV